MGIAGLYAMGTQGCFKSKVRPNVIFILADDHAAPAISSYNGRLNHTPNLDRLATEGARLTNTFCTNSICAPSRASILTGKYSHKNGMVDNLLPFDGDQMTFPKLFQNVGYETALIGKWHLKSDPQGFDYWKIFPTPNDQGDYYRPEFSEMGKRETHTGYATDLITDFSLEWLKNREKEKPFCLLYQHKAPHGPWLPDSKYFDLYDDEDKPVPDNFFDDFQNRHEGLKTQEATIARHMSPRLLKTTESPPARMTADEKQKYVDTYEVKNKALKEKKLSEKDLALWKYQRYIKDYLRTIKSIDDNVGRVLDYLDAAGEADNTIVVYTSDQGFFLGEHGLYDKRFMYEESIRMPFLIRYPEKISPGTVNNDMILNIDFAPTLLDLANIEIPAEMQGESFADNLLGDTPENWRQSMYYQYYEYPSWHMIKRHYGIRTQRYKLIHYYYDIDEWELFDLKKDPHEMKSVYKDPAYQDVVQQLKIELEKLRKKYGDSEALDQKYLKERPGQLRDHPARTKEYPHLEHLR